MSSGLCEQTVRQLTDAYPVLQERAIATTAFGRPVQVMTIGTGDRHVILSAAHHANEWITATILLKFTEDLARADGESGKIWGVNAQTILKYSTLHILPMVDPDGAT